MVAGATLWDGVAIAAAPGWYGGEASQVSAAAALILFGVGVLLLAAVVLADRDLPLGGPVAGLTTERGGRGREEWSRLRDRPRPDGPRGWALGPADGGTACCRIWPCLAP